MQLNILEYLENGRVSGFGNRTAIVGLEASYTFAQLERHSKCCAELLLQRTDALSQPIAVFLPKSADVIFADLGIVYTGNIYTNLDIKSPARRIHGILENIGPILVITSRALASQLEEIGLPDNKLFFIEDIYDESIKYDSGALWTRLERVVDTDPLCIINTSGSTGIPKGVVLNHRSTIDFMDWCFGRFRFNGNERIGSLSPFYFDIYTLELNLCIAKGATIIIIPDDLAIFPVKLMQFVSENAVSFIFWVPSIMVNLANKNLLKTHDLSALRTVFFAGEIFPMKHLNVWRRDLPGVMFVNLHGPIEITVDCTYFVLDREFADNEALPIGFPCRNTDVLILNDANQLCKTGEQGELCVRGSSLAMGYWNDLEKTACAFVQNPRNTRYLELIYRTGDLVYRNARNEIMFVGRKDFQIKHMGYRIELSEIEYQVLSIREIDNACVVYNQEKKEIAVFYETKSHDVTPVAIRRELLKIFPKYMVPTVFHPMAELPRNPNGKIDRAGLNAQFQHVTIL